ncbi:MAG: sporulation protein YunB [Clostridiales bacterium]|nr:sporulation protein YunB [Clostridiales bacterium]MDD6873490.1 sporulation protein YunB [Clostridiales bacterium]MDD7366939.1 sporulation protein YunB [Clostridiales bacterium]
MVSKKVRRLSFFLIPLAVLAGLFILFTRNLSPILISMAEARARQLAVEAMNRAIAEVMDSSVTYTDLMRVSHDSSGRVSMLEANATLMNEIASAAALTAQSKLDTLADEGVGLPLFAALGIDLFSGAGPIIRVSITPVGAVSTRFVTSFESAGINQTRHEISLEASVVMRIVIPAGADSVSVSTYVPIAESIIVGSVPESYVSVPDGETALNLIP